MIVKFPNGALAAAALASLCIKSGKCHDISEDCFKVSGPVLVQFFSEPGDDLIFADFYDLERKGLVIKPVRTLAEFNKIIELIDEDINKEPVELGTAIRHMRANGSDGIVADDDHYIQLYDSGGVRVGCKGFPKESADLVIEAAKKLAKTGKLKTFNVVGITEDSEDVEYTIRATNNRHISFDGEGSMTAESIIKLGQLRDKVLRAAGKAKPAAKAKPVKFDLFSAIPK